MAYALSHIVVSKEGFCSVGLVSWLVSILTTEIVFLNGINRLGLVVEKQCVFCDMERGYLYLRRTSH
jgi:hypothetical protein